MREITYTVSADSISPAGLTDAGFQCEYNATQVTFELADSLISEIAGMTGEVSYVLEVINGEGVFSMYTLDTDGGTPVESVGMILPDCVTIPGSLARIQLAVIELDDDGSLKSKLYTPGTSVRFGKSVTGELMGGSEYNRYARNLVGTMKLAVSAAETAVSAASAAEEYSGSAEQKAGDAASSAAAAASSESLAASSAAAAASSKTLAASSAAAAASSKTLAGSYASQAGSSAQTAAAAALSAGQASAAAAEDATFAAASASSASSSEALAGSYASQAAASAAEARALANKKWQLLISTTTQEAIQFVQTAAFSESDGVIGIFVRFNAPAADPSPNVSLRLYDSSNTEKMVITGTNYISATGETFGKIMCRMDHGLWDGWWTAVTGSASSGWTGKYSLRYDESAVTETDMPFIRRAIVGVANGNTMPAGTNVEIWGLK